MTIIILIFLLLLLSLSFTGGDRGGAFVKRSFMKLTSSSSSLLSSRREIRDDDDDDDTVAECWFCPSGAPTKVFVSKRLLQRNRGWNCPSCEQFNGFDNATSSGYTKTVEGMHSSHDAEELDLKLKVAAKRNCINDSDDNCNGNGPSLSLLCNTCQRKQELKLERLREWDREKCHEDDPDYINSDDPIELDGVGEDDDAEISMESISKRKQQLQQWREERREMIDLLEDLNALCDNCEEKVNRHLKQLEKRYPPPSRKTPSPFLNHDHRQSSELRMSENCNRSNRKTTPQNLGGLILLPEHKKNTRRSLQFFRDDSSRTRLFRYMDKIHSIAVFVLIPVLMAYLLFVMMNWRMSDQDIGFNFVNTEFWFRKSTFATLVCIIVSAIITNNGLLFPMVRKCKKF